MALDRGTGARRRRPKPRPVGPTTRQAQRDLAIEKRQKREAEIVRLVDESIAGTRPPADIAAELLRLKPNKREAEIAKGRDVAAERARLHALRFTPPALLFPESVKGGAGQDFSPGWLAAELAAIVPIGRAARGAKAGAELIDRISPETIVRSLRIGERVQQLPAARSPITRNLIEKPADALSRVLEGSGRVARAARATPVVRNIAASRRVAKHAGREEAQEAVRSAARMAEHLDVLKIGPLAKRGGVEFAHTWWAQLPRAYRSAEGLKLVREKQAGELAEIASGKALQEIVAQQQEVASALKAARDAGDTRRVFALMERAQDLKILASDLPAQADDLARSIAMFDQVIAKPPKLDAKKIRALHALAESRKANLVAEGLLDPARAAEREGLISRWVGLEPTGEEIYFGHRLGKVAGANPSLMPRSVGTGRVKVPAGVSRENKLVLAKTGRTAQTFETAVRDWQASQVFESTGRVRRILGEIGRPFEGRVPKDHLLVNLRGRAVPKQWKVLQEVGDDLIEDDVVRAADEILKGSFARSGKEANDMLAAAKEAGVQWDELRVIHQDLASRVFDQFTPAGRAGRALTAYDRLVDLTAASIVFARLGYIPKNVVQNLVMAVPHQGPFLLVNGVRAGQVMRDPKLRALVNAEVGFSGATRALGKEARTQKAVGKVIGFVGSVADDPMRASAFLHEAAAEGVISKVRPVLNAADRRRLIRLFEDPTLRSKLNNIRARANDAMADFSRMTPKQRRDARRLLIIPGWLMAGSRYPFHFAATHPVRSALLAYIAMGEPGAPERLQLNPPITRLFEGENYLQGIATPYGRLRTGSLNPVTTPWEIASAAFSTARGKDDPFAFGEPTAFDYGQPLGTSSVEFFRGGGVESFKRLAPNIDFIQDLISPESSPRYPGDATRLGRLKRELGVIPIEVRDEDGGGRLRPKPGASTGRKRRPKPGS